MKLSDNKSIFKIQFILIVIMLVNTAPFIINIGAQNTQNITNDIFTIEYLENNNIELTFFPPEITYSSYTNEYGQFTLISMKEAGYHGDLGKPMLPLITRHIALPDSTASIEIVDIQIKETINIGNIYPAQPAHSDDTTYMPQEFVLDQEFYTQNEKYPNQLVSITKSGILRDIPFTTIAISPVQFNPSTKITTIYQSITIQINPANNNDLKVEYDFKQTNFYPLYTNTFLNWDSFMANTRIIQKEKPNLNPSDRSEGCDHLIITHPNFYDAIKDLAVWRHQTGMMTNLINVTDIGSSSSQIQTYIQNAYDTWNPQPSFILLVGDAEFIPLSSSDSDLYYATVDGTDYFPDIYIGRIPVDTLEETEIIVEKILKYDQTPPSSSDFYKNIALAAYFQDDENNGYETRRFVRTSEEIRDNLTAWGYTGERIYCTESYVNPTHYNNGYYGNGEPLPNELLRPTFAWDGDAIDIRNAVDNGVFILNHRDHGATWGWGDPHFDNDDVLLLNNGDLTPVVFSINCLTGAFQNGEVFCEVFLRKDNGGAVAIYGATDVSYSGYNDFLCLGYYDAIWPDLNPNLGEDYSLNKLGQILNNGKVYMTLTWGDGWGLEQRTFELHHIFGDPAQSIRTRPAKTFEIDHPPTIPYGSSMVEITVTKSGQPVENALVCLRQTNNVYARGYTDNTGLVELEVDIQEPDEAMLTVTGYNFLPYETTIQIGSSLPPLPPIVDGIPVGKPNKEYTYTAETTDPEGDQILYKFDWGDGTQSDWIGPVNSGESISISHAWQDVGNYTLKVRAKDFNDSISYWSEPYNIHMTLPVIDLSTIQGGLLRASVNVRNYGLAEADDISWSIILDGGFILLGKETTGIIPTIAAGDVTTVSTGPIFGFGATRVIATVEIDEGSDYRSQGANLILFFIQVKPGGG